MDNTLWTLIIILIALAAISLIFHLGQKWQPHKDFKGIFQRIRMWWGMFGIFSLATLFNPVVSLISIMLLSFFSLKEYFSMIKTRRQDRRLFLWAYASIPVQFYWIYTGWYGMFIIFIPIYVFLFLPLPRLINKGTVGFLQSVSSTQWGLMLMVFGLSHLAFYPIATPEFGGNLVLFLVLLTQINDVANYIVSLYWGKRKVVPTANPYITWEGFVAAMLATSAAAFLLYAYLTPFGILYSVLSGLLISLSGFFGSLTVSVLRRNLLIGEGSKYGPLKESYLSRIDSLTYTSPVFLHVTRYFFDFM